MDRNTTFSANNLLMYGREKINITGVLTVDTFDENSIVMTVENSTLTIEGSHISITVLDLEKGCVEAEGIFSAAYYSDAPSVKKGILSRIFRG